MQTAKSKIENMCTTMFILLSALALVLLSGHSATAGYADSAHGDTSYGVDRSTAACAEWPGGVCVIGSCAQCHDTFDPAICGVNVLMLFAANDTDFCLKCHENTTNYATTAIVNRSYSFRAGGWTSDPLDDIRETFNSTSSHDLDDIKTFIDGKWGYTADSNPCTACHNQHLAEGDPENAPNDAKSSGTRGWPVSLPSEHNLGIWDLWGDDSAERMNVYSANYQAPYRYGSSSAYEPDGSTTTDGSNLTDYNTFCTDCHNTTYTIYSTALGRDLIQIDWENEIHGQGDANDSLCGDAPYPSGTSGLDKVLSCLDCHEPHGSPNLALLRQEVNGDTLTANITTMPPQFPPEDCNWTDDAKEFSWLCNRCHNSDQDINGDCPSDTWYNIHHGDTQDPPDECTNDYPYSKLLCGTNCHASSSAHNWNCTNSVVGPIDCKCCHYHGSIRDDCDYEPTTRRTF